MAAEDRREGVIEAINDARSDLDRALNELDRMPTLDPGVVAFVAYAMSNYRYVPSHRVPGAQA